MMNKSGITLIALIITIIVLLILAGVSISAIVGDNGVVKNAMVASEKTEIESEREMIQTEYVSKKMENIDEESIDEKVIGEKLKDSSIESGENWKVVMVKDENGNNTMYGTGWNYISKGTEINGNILKYPWLLNIQTGETIQLEEENVKEVDASGGVAVVGEDLKLNLDAMSLNSDNWDRGVINHGGVEFNEKEKALIFDGEDDYIELQKAGDFSNGFTFEMYMNLCRREYDNGGGGNKCSGLFCKMPSLSSNVANSMRFGYCSGAAICKFSNGSSFSNSESNTGLYTREDGSIIPSNGNPGYEIEKDAYLSFVYTVNNDDSNQDKVEYYIDGELYGSTFYGHDSYQNGCETWNKTECPLFIGVCPWNKTGDLFYLQGKVYATRLYTKALTKDEVKANYDKTLESRKDMNNN